MIKTELPPEKQNEMRLYNTSFHEKGRIEGRIEGRVEGRIEGRIEGRVEGRIEGRIEGRVEGERLAKLSALSRLIERKFGESVLALYREKIEELAITEIDALFDVAIFFDDAAELASWFSNRL